MIYALLYVSESMVAHADGQAAVRQIVDVSRPRNAALDVTGALIFAESHFAQILEGPRPAVEDLMASIRRDQRHRNLRILREGPLFERRFARWSLAYFGPSILLADLFEPGDTDVEEQAERMTAVMMHFAAFQEGG